MARCECGLKRERQSCDRIYISNAKLPLTYYTRDLCAHSALYNAYAGHVRILARTDTRVYKVNMQKNVRAQKGILGLLFVLFLVSSLPLAEPHGQFTSHSDLFAFMHFSNHKCHCVRSPSGSTLARPFP